MKRVTKPLLAAIAALTMASMSQSAELEVDLDLKETGEPINPFIYGQFIEHLGRCVYGGIWAEMLEDRKFYFEVTEDYNPYKRLQDTDYPVVGASPWEITGNVSGLTMTTEDSFVGEQTPQLNSGSGIRQNDLATVSGKKYDGYIWLKNTGKEKSSVNITFSSESKSITVKGRDYKKYPFSFTASEDSTAVTLAINVDSGSVLVGTASIMPADNIKGMRADTIGLLKELDSPIYRWPGGNFVSGYNWRDGIGDRDRRPPRKNPAWTGVEHNDFGTDEFIAFCREINTVATIAANTGFGDAYSAAQWVEYCNSGSDTIGGSWRIENGNAKPFDVKYWCVGNEMWGPWQLGFMQLSQYIIKNNEIVDAMREVDPDLELIAVGAVDQINTDYDPDAAKAERLWSVGMLEDSSNHMTMLSEHFYSGRTPWTEGGEIPTTEHVGLLKTQIRRIVDEHRRIQPTIKQLNGKTMPVSMDEWNYWHRDYQYGELGCVYDLKDALGTVVGLHEYYRSSDIIQIANYAQTVNVIGCIKTSKTEAEFATTGIVLKLYRAEWQSNPLTLADAFGDHDVAASISDDGKTLTVSIVNPTDQTSSVALNIAGINLPSTATVWTITGPSHNARNAPGETRQVDAIETPQTDISSGLAAPALSSVLYRIEL